MQPTDSADRYWNAEWARADAGSVWNNPEPEVLNHAATLPPASRVLDLGAGLGRHALAFARLGHSVAALDAAEHSVDAIRSAAQAETLSVAAHLGRMTDLPFADASFDHVLAWNVIYHGNAGVVARSIAEIARVLRPGGNFMGTMLSSRRLAVERAKAPGQELSHNTWVFEGEGDKHHPHYFCSARELIDHFTGFEIWSLQDRQQGKPGAWHWHLLAERLA